MSKQCFYFKISSLTTFSCAGHLLTLVPLTSPSGDFGHDALQSWFCTVLIPTFSAVQGPWVVPGREEVAKIPNRQVKGKPYWSKVISPGWDMHRCACIGVWGRSWDVFPRMLVVFFRFSFNCHCFRGGFLRRQREGEVEEKQEGRCHCGEGRSGVCRQKPLEGSQWPEQEQFHWSETASCSFFHSCNLTHPHNSCISFTVWTSVKDHVTKYSKLMITINFKPSIWLWWLIFSNYTGTRSLFIGYIRAVIHYNYSSPIDSLI